ncbi:hypothetical protein C8J57DRAFT_1526343 [Mycena rebaudengoi]|nr:hypothetical protein C8J57DRAFT_1526343 [Mycena rebaudengoi]
MVTVVFVFDGPGRPALKHGKRVIAKPHWLTDEFQVLIEVFGFYFYTAPGEAEAELAQLNRRSVIDAVMTTDCDVFVFGATHVIDSPKKQDYTNLRVYTADAVKRVTQLSLGGLLLMAVFVGGDYDDGLPDCAIGISHALAKRGLGDSLLLAAQMLAPTELDTFLKVWRNTLHKELVEGNLGRKYLVVAKGILDNFPDPRILDLYINPLTSWSSGGPGVTSSLWVPRVPDVQAISKICEHLFSWGTVAELPKKIAKTVLPGLCVRRLAAIQSPSEVTALRNHFVDVHVGPDFPPLAAFICIKAFSHGFYRHEKHRTGIVKSSTLLPMTVIIPVPPAILLRALPAMVQRYQIAHPKKIEVDPLVAPVFAMPVIPATLNAVAGPSSHEADTIYVSSDDEDYVDNSLLIDLTQDDSE